MGGAWGLILLAPGRESQAPTSGFSLEPTGLTPLRPGAREDVHRLAGAEWGELAVGFCVSGVASRTRAAARLWVGPWGQPHHVAACLLRLLG